MLERGEARSVRDLPEAQDRIEMDEREAVVGAHVAQLEAKTGRHRRIADAAKVRIFQVEKAVAHTLGEAIFPVAAPLELEQVS
jgi:hypothetical protein